MPAAVLGILVVILVGILYTRGMLDVRGDVTTSTSSSPADRMEIHLTESGASPAAAHAHPGQTITWINDRSTAQILQSDNIKDGSGETLYSSLIQPGASIDFVISPKQDFGKYDYGSITSKSLTGTLIIDPTTSSTPLAQSSSSSISSTFMVDLEISSEASSLTTSSVSSQDSQIPHNPYTVTSHYFRPLLAGAKSIPSPSTSLHSGAPSLPLAARYGKQYSHHLPKSQD